MIFTHKSQTYPKTTLKSVDKELVKEFKFLGMTFDSPGCTSGKDIDRVKTKSVSNINLLSIISGRARGSDRETFLLL